MENQQLDATSSDWIPVDKAYLGSLRILLAMVHFFGVVVASFFIWLLPASFFIWLLPAPAHIIPSLIAGLLALSFILMFFVWAPRSTRRMRYLLREQDINLQRGLLFWKLISVSCNRIQHLEVRQGPIERRFGLAELLIYTAGAQGSNLKIPGLTLAKAQQLKSQLLDNVNAEAADVAEPL